MRKVCRVVELADSIFVDFTIETELSQLSSYLMLLVHEQPVNVKKFEMLSWPTDQVVQ